MKTLATLAVFAIAGVIVQASNMFYGPSFAATVATILCAGWLCVTD